MKTVVPRLIYPRLVKFNRKINIQSFYRTLSSGAKVLVKPSSRRAGAMRIALALEDLRKTGRRKTETAYVVSKSGRVSQQIQGEEGRVSIPDLERRESMKGNQILHNHPYEASLSGPDLAVAKKYDTQISAIDPSGNVYRGKAKEQYSPDHHYKVLKEMERPPNLRNKRRIHSFLAQHNLNENLAERGVIQYRSKLTPKFKAIDDKHKAQYQEMASSAYTKAYAQLDKRGDILPPTKQEKQRYLDDSRSQRRKTLGEYPTSVARQRKGDKRIALDRRMTGRSLSLERRGQKRKGFMTGLIADSHKRLTRKKGYKTISNKGRR